MHSNSRSFFFISLVLGFCLFSCKFTVNVETTSILGKFANRKIGTYMERRYSGLVLEFCSQFVEIDHGKNGHLELVLSWPCMWTINTHRSQSYCLPSEREFLSETRNQDFRWNWNGNSWAGTENNASDMKFESGMSMSQSVSLTLFITTHHITRYHSCIGKYYWFRAMLTFLPKRIGFETSEFKFIVFSISAHVCYAHRAYILYLCVCVCWTWDKPKDCFRIPIKRYTKPKDIWDM